MPIVITARRDGFRRCDRAHPARPTTYPDDFFTPEELAVLKAEPMLDVREATHPSPSGRGAGGEGPPPAKKTAKAGQTTPPATP